MLCIASCQAYTVLEVAVLAPVLARQFCGEEFCTGLPALARDRAIPDRSFVFIVRHPGEFGAILGTPVIYELELDSSA